MKILIIGLGGIGSYLIHEIAEAVMQNQIDADTIFDIADGDMVECKNTKFQNFTENDIGKNKAQQLAKRYKDDMLIKNAIKERIIEEKQLKDYDLIICCADNTPTRDLLFRYCHKNNIQFIDLRARGRYIMAFQRSNDLRADLDTLDLGDTIAGSCQTKEDLDRGIIQKGNKIVAVIGCQMLLNDLRGIQNSKILMRI